MDERGDISTAPAENTNGKGWSMNTKRISLVSVILVMVAVGSASAQTTLGDMVAQGGYDWLIGRWTATTDDGDTVHFEQTWTLDRNAILVDFRTPDFDYRGIIAFMAFREEVVQYGADDRGSIYEGLWRQEYDAAVHRVEQTKPDGTVAKMELVHKRGPNNTIEMAVYNLESDGWRAAQPWVELTFKPRTADLPAGGSSSHYSYYENLGDLVSQLGYEWVAGHWKASRPDGSAIDLKYTWVLDKYALAVDAQAEGFKYQGLIVFVPYREEVIQMGADNMGGIWNGTWTETYEGISHRTEGVQSDGVKRRVEHVYVIDGKDAFTLKEYRIDANGYRAGAPSGSVTFKRVPTETSN